MEPFSVLDGDRTTEHRGSSFFPSTTSSYPASVDAFTIYQPPFDMDNVLCCLAIANHMYFRYEHSSLYFPIHSLYSFFVAYFIVEAPSLNGQWVNNATNVASWVKGAQDGIFGFDMEMTRMSQDGLFLMAKNGE